MKEKQNLIQDIKTHLDESVDSLDSKTRSQISAARYRAIEQGYSKRFSWAIPTTGLAGAVAAVFILISVFGTKGIEIRADQLEMVEILASEEQLDLYENLEFYAWLAENSLAENFMDNPNQDVDQQSGT